VPWLGLLGLWWGPDGKRGPVSPHALRLRVRLVNTGCFVACVLAGYALQLPGALALGEGAMSAVDTFDVFGPRALIQKGNLFTLGTFPAVNASIVAYFWYMLYPPFKQEIEHGGQEVMDDARLKLSCVFAAGQAASVAWQLKAAAAAPGFWALFKLGVQLLAGWAVFTELCDRMTAYGVGEGVYNIIALNILMEYVSVAGTILALFVSGGAQAAATAGLVPPAALSLVLLAVGLTSFGAAVAFVVGTKERVPIQYFARTGLESARRQLVRRRPEISLPYCGFGIFPLIIAEFILGGTFYTGALTSALLGRPMLPAALTAAVSGTLLARCVAKAAVLLPTCLVYGFFSYKEKLTSLATSLQHHGVQIEGVPPGQETLEFLLKRQIRANNLGSVAFTGLAVLATVAQDLQTQTFGVDFNLISLMLLIGWATKLKSQVGPIVAQERSFAKVDRKLGRWSLASQEPALMMGPSPGPII